MNIKTESPEWILLYFAQLAPLHQLISWSKSAFLLDPTIVCTHCLRIRKQNHSVLKVAPATRRIIKFTQGSLFFLTNFFLAKKIIDKISLTKKLFTKKKLTKKIQTIFFCQNFVWPINWINLLRSLTLAIPCFPLFPNQSHSCEIFFSLSFVFFWSRS